MVTLSSCLISQLISFILLPNEYIVYTLEQRWANWAGDRLTEDTDFGKKKSSFQMKQNLAHLGHRKPACIHWKADAPKTSHCLVRTLVQRNNLAIFLRKWARRSRFSQWRSLSDRVKRIFVHKNWRGGYLQHLVLTGRRYVPHSRNYTRCFAPCFWRSHYKPQVSFGHLRAAIRQARDNWRFKGQYSWSHWWNTAAHSR